MNVNSNHLLLGLLLSSGISLVAYWRESLSASGIVGAVLTGTLIFGLGGWLWGWLLIAFFISSSVLSHYRELEKQSTIAAFEKGGQRGLGQALANGGLGMLLAIIAALRPSPVLFLAFLGAMAAVTADTWATELGVLSRKPPWLITTGHRVPPGTSGGITLMGTAASVAGGGFIGLIAYGLVWGGLRLGVAATVREETNWIFEAAVAGFIGALFDSLLGATLQQVYYCNSCGKETERRVHHCGNRTRPLHGLPWLNNDVVNFLSSVVGSLVAVGLGTFVG
ncbi:MAG TPA: DUF92 domain-containing protein [Anaerolineae bacterium]|nr:DUF92 domain-containing protein [Anaerolineae bacterium]